MTSVHVNRSLQALRRAALIAVDGRRIVIPNVAALEAVAAFDRATCTGRERTACGRLRGTDARSADRRYLPRRGNPHVP